MFFVFINIKKYGIYPCKLFGVCFILIKLKCDVFWLRARLEQIQAYDSSPATYNNHHQNQQTTSIIKHQTPSIKSGGVGVDNKGGSCAL